jgi:hypothetical protein
VVTFGSGPIAGRRHVAGKAHIEVMALRFKACGDKTAFAILLQKG